MNFGYVENATVGSGLEHHTMTEPLQLLNVAAGSLLAIPLLQIRGPQLPVGSLMRQYVIDDQQKRMGHGTAFLWPRCRIMRR